MSEKKQYEFAHPELLRALTESGDGLAIFHADWRYAYVDGLAAQLVGYEPKDIIGKFVFEVCYEEEGNYSCSAQKRAMDERTFTSSEDYFVRVDRWYRTLCYPMTEGGLLVLFRNITREHRADDVREGNFIAVLERYERIIEGNQSGIWKWHRETKSWYRSSHWKAMLGYTEEEMPDEDIPPTLYHPDDLPKLVKVFEDFVAGIQTEYRMEYRLLNKNGTYNRILSRATAIRNPDGTARMVSGTYTDISQPKAVAERLHLLESAVVHANDAIIITEAEAKDGAGRPILYVNGAFTEMTGFSADEVIGQSLTKLQGVDTNMETLADIRDHQLKNEGFRVELESKRKDGTPFWSEVNVQPVKTNTGEVTHWINAQRDITERKAIEASLFKETKRQERIADTLQKSLLRQPNSGVLPGLDVSQFYEAALEEARVGGDFFDVFALPGRRVALIVGDVMGKGLAAAEVTAEVKFTLRHILHEVSDPVWALTRLNAYRFERQQLDPDAEQPFICLTVAVFNSVTRQVSFAVAGSEAPIILRAATQEIETFRGGGLPIGIEQNWSQDQSNQSFHLAANDLLLLYTDGLTEARNEAMAQMFGVEGITNIVTKVKSTDSIDAIAVDILSAAQSFTNGSLQDDVCLLIARHVPGT